VSIDKKPPKERYAMNDILEKIKEYASTYDGEQAAIFVFPSESAASFWAEKTLLLFNLKTIAKEHFIAWDSFKEKNIHAENKNKRPVNKVIRLLFAHCLIRANKKEHFLHYLIPNVYANEGMIFAKTITSMLPSLKLWRRKIEDFFSKEKTPPFDSPMLKDEYEFLTELERRYTAFLEDNSLFEPSWENPPFRNKENAFYLFYPSLIEDFCEYEELLDVPNVHKIPIALTDDRDENQLLLYESSRAELKFLVSEIRRLYKEESIPYEEMFVSVPELQTLEPYIKREFYLHNIPANIRLGKALAEYREGLLWKQINDCAQNNFSFSSIRNLLFNFSLPWRTPNKNASLIKFGIKNNCVSGYREKGKKKDIWEEAFWGKEKKMRLRNHYRKLKSYCLHIAHSKNFGDFNQWAYRFIKKFFIKIDIEDNNVVLGRILKELKHTKDIIDEIIENCPYMEPSSSLEFFISVLKEKAHVKDEKKTGVQVFPYGVAASAPARAHFIINVNQKSTTKIYHPLAFVQRASRKALNMEDIDMSKDLFKSFNVRSELDSNRKNYVYYSASLLTFSGWVLPHTYFDRIKSSKTGNASKPNIKNAAPPENDLFSLERKWWTQNEDVAAQIKEWPASVDFFDKDKRILPIQKLGFNKWSPFAVESDFNLLKKEFRDEWTVSTLLKKRIHIIKKSEHGVYPLKNSEKHLQKNYGHDGILRVSATALKNFFNCQTYWFFKEILKIETYELNPVLLDDMTKGLLYHKILKELFEIIRENDKEAKFNKNNLKQYYHWADSTAEKITRKFPAFRGPLARPMLGSMASSLSQKIKKLLDEEAENFDGWIISDLEKEYRVKKEDVILHGFIDRVSLSDMKDSAMIVDYKTGTPPTITASTQKLNSPLTDFQIALYIKIYEDFTGLQVCNASFFSINASEYKNVIKNVASRGSYQKTIDSLNDFIDYYKQSILKLDFTPRTVKNDNDDLKPDFSTKAIPLKHCYTCIYKYICRTTYSLNAGECYDR
jgi:hypothetical protein